MTTETVEVRDLQENSYVMIDEVPCRIADYTTSRPGKHGSAKARVEGKGVFDDKRRVFTAPVDAKIEQPRVRKRDGQIVNIDDSEVQVMDLESYETFKIIADGEDYKTDEEITFLQFEENRRIVENG